jgi:PAS domain S-box-containing protein
MAINRPVWIINSNYAEFARLRKFAVACNYPAGLIVQLNDLEEVLNSKQSPLFILISNEFEQQSGAKSIKAFKQQFSKIPVILLCTDNEDQSAVLCEAIGAQDYLIKSEITLPLFRKSIQYAISRNRILNELQRSKDEYMSIFREHPLPMWVYNMEDLSFVAVNKAAIFYYGYTEQEFLSMTIKDIRPTEDIPALLNTVQRNYKSGFYDDNHWTHIKKNGEQIKVHIYSHKIDFDDIPCKMVTAVKVNLKSAEQ